MTTRLYLLVFSTLLLGGCTSAGDDSGNRVAIQSIKSASELIDRIEDLVIVTDTGHENITPASKELLELDA